MSQIVKTLKKDYPEFIIGFEFEGYVKKSRRRDYDDYGDYECDTEDLKKYDKFFAELEKIHPDIDVGEDGSIEVPYSGYWEPVELRTEALPLKEGLALLDKLLVLFAKYKEMGVWGTNKSCGFHINLSEKNIFKEYVAGEKFYCRMLQKFHQRKILRKFGRSNNDYCNVIPVKKDWKTNFNKLYQEFRNNSHDCGMRDKYLAMAFRNGERIEFRCLGNANYELKTDKIRDTIAHIYDCAIKSYSECVDDPYLNKEPKIKYNNKTYQYEIVGY